MYGMRRREWRSRCSVGVRLGMEINLEGEAGYRAPTSYEDQLGSMEEGEREGEGEGEEEAAGVRLQRFNGTSIYLILAKPAQSTKHSSHVGLGGSTEYGVAPQSTKAARQVAFAAGHPKLSHLRPRRPSPQRGVQACSDAEDARDCFEVDEVLLSR